MNSLSKSIAKKTGLSKYEIDAILKVAAYEMIELLREKRSFQYEGLGTIFTYIVPNGLNVKISLSPEALDRLNKDINKEGRKDEIIFE